jgi:hypothetical protein
MESIRLTGTTDIEVFVNPSDVIREAIKLVRKGFALTNVDTLEGDRMFEYVEYATSHSWQDKEDRGIATKDQKKALTAIDILKKTEGLVWEA